MFYRAKYSASGEVKEAVNQQKFDMRGMGDRLKHVMLHDQDIIDKRWAECEKCEFLLKPTNTCKKCGCFMGIKHRIGTSSCPIGKWGAEYDFMKGRPINGTKPATK